MSTPDTTSETPAPGRTAKYRASANAIWYDDMVLARLSGFADTDESAAELVHRANCYESLLEVARLLEWAGTAEGDGEAYSQCPCCFSVDWEGHKKNCELAQAIATATKGAHP